MVTNYFGISFRGLFLFIAAGMFHSFAVKFPKKLLYPSAQKGLYILDGKVICSILLLTRYLFCAKISPLEFLNSQHEGPKHTSRCITTAAKSQFLLRYPSRLDINKSAFRSIQRFQAYIEK